MPALNENIRALISSTQSSKLQKFIPLTGHMCICTSFLLEQRKHCTKIIRLFFPMYLGPLGFLLMGQCKCYMLMQQQGTERSCILCVSLLLSCMLKIIRNNKKLLRILRQHNIKPSMGLV